MSLLVECRAAEMLPETPSFTDRVAVALDTDDRAAFSAWCRTFGPRVGVLKVGLEAFVRWGPPAVAEARSAGRSVFLDLKLHDIPNTVAGAVRSARELGVSYLTVHAGGGPAMIEAAAHAAGDDLSILAVTLLTHLDEPLLRPAGREPTASSARRSRRPCCAGPIRGRSCW